MFKEMRRKKQILSLEECIEILNRRTSGVLAVSGDNDYPYSVPLSYAYYNNKIIFHSAKSGHKLEAIARNEKVSFCVIDKDQIVPDEYTSYFRSIIVFGKARIIEDGDEKISALEILAKKYAPGHEESRRMQTINRELNTVCIIELSVEHMSGKEAIELVRNNSFK